MNISATANPTPLDERILFLDTNSLLHYPPFSDMNWKRICGSKRVRLVLCLQVIQELDEKKSDPRLGDRARRTIKEAKRLLAADGTVQPDVTIEVFNRPVNASDLPDTLSVDSKDDRIVQAVRLLSISEPNSSIAVYSEDMGMSLRCQAHNITVIEPDTALRLVRYPSRA